MSSYGYVGRKCLLYYGRGIKDNSTNSRFLTMMTFCAANELRGLRIGVFDM